MNIINLWKLHASRSWKSGFQLGSSYIQVFLDWKIHMYSMHHMQSVRRKCQLQCMHAIICYSIHSNLILKTMTRLCVFKSLYTPLLQWDRNISSTDRHLPPKISPLSQNGVCVLWWELGTSLTALQTALAPRRTDEVTLSVK